jgi:hypothetical protein
MFSIGLRSKHLFSKGLPLTFAIAAILMFIQPGYSDTGTTGAVSLDTGFHYMYNLDFAAAHKTFEAWEEQHPDDPMGAASNAAAYLFSEFERLNILKIDLFAEAKKLESITGKNPDPAIKAAFDSELAKVDEMTSQLLSQSSADHNALFAKMLSDGLRGDYAALIERQNHAGLNFLKSSRSAAEKLLNLDPGCSDAYLALGIENYILGLRSAPTRWVLRLSGAQTDKEKGIESLKVTAEKGHYLAPYARLLLAIAALRDEDKTTAKKLLAELAQEFPQNRLFRVELARLRS